MIEIKHLEHFYQEIQGWTTFEDLYRAIVRTYPNGAHFVEVGVWRGRSSAFMAVEILNSGKNITFDAIDTFDGSEEHLDPNSGWFVKELMDDKDYLYKDCLKNLEPVIEYVNVIRGASVEKAKDYTDGSLDFVFIDGSHKKQDVYDDIVAWFPKIKVGGYIAGHDVSHWEVREAVEDFSKETSIQFFSDTTMDIWFHKVEPEVELPYHLAYSKRETIDFSYQSVFDTLHLDGDIVECGVAAGAQIITFKKALEKVKSRKRIYAFDSYCGIPYAGPNDTEQPGVGAIEHDTSLPIENRLRTTGVTVHSLGEVKDNFIRHKTSLDEVFFCEGWFQDTLPEYAEQIERISILRLDGDLYESTLVCLEHLYPKVVKGGFVIIDDYGLDGCRKACEDYFGEVPPLINIDGGGVHYFIK